MRVALSGKGRGPVRQAVVEGGPADARCRRRWHGAVHAWRSARLRSLSCQGWPGGGRLNASGARPWRHHACVRAWMHARSVGAPSAWCMDGFLHAVLRSSRPFHPMQHACAVVAGQQPLPLNPSPTLTMGPAQRAPAPRPCPCWCRTRACGTGHRQRQRQEAQRQSVIHVVIPTQPDRPGLCRPLGQCLALARVLKPGRLAA